jgi:alkylation response protein AidB-like acyl-CoA dehydrogenase
MDLTPDYDSADLAAGLRDLLSTRLDGRALRDAIANRETRDALWQELSEQGVPATLIPETFDGLELGWPAAVMMLEEFGRSGAPGPLIDALTVAPDVLSLFGGQFGDVLTRIAQGGLKIGLADRSGRVCAFEDLDAVLVRTHATLGLYPVAHVDFAPLSSLDEGVSTARVTVTGAPDADVALDDAQVQRIEAAGMLATAATLIGVSRRMLAITTDYVSQRVAFGKIIGSFQAIQHPLVEVALRIEVAAPIIQAAAWALSQGRSDAVERAAHAKLAAIQASNLAWRVCLQSHGAIGYTAEYDLQIWLKRSLTLAAQHGSAAEVRRLLRALLVERVELRNLDSESGAVDLDPRESEAARLPCQRTN